MFITRANNTFPPSWKTGRVTPLHKKGALKGPSKYRSISTLPVLSKILEKHVLNSTLSMNFLVNDLLSSRQSGFCNQHSCETALNQISDEWLNIVYTSVLYIDLCKAFDLVDHSILLQKLKICQSSESAVKWFQSYWSDRKQFVKINKSFGSKPLQAQEYTRNGAVIYFSPVCNCWLSFSKEA